ncbi:ABC transporter substrate-binding protein [Amycolatopsis thailandensis]|uniref:ABC transporter substrate-binding protein n=1 Tax=Amycolatopsis thailandensis TaxID=589330 RepID=A0A229S977_9PSEU|nr:YbaB/EbfC family nucleoid-associated protein [Amycolatopsis thailandensis]OXM55430.1 ABC transporter substrate-binding protein [Amycolatopsis thailandensis]
MTAPQDPRVFRDQVRSMEARLTGTMHIGRSADQAVAATVTGRGELVDLRISDNALDRAHPQLLGTSIVQAVYAARGAAHTAAVPELAALIGKEPPSPSTPEWETGSPARPSPASPVETAIAGRRARAARDEVPDEESYDQVDFLSDEDFDDRGGRR